MPIFQNATLHYESDQAGGGETLHVTDIGVAPPGAISAIPEPGTWALISAGVAMLGVMLRFGRRREGAALAA